MSWVAVGVGTATVIGGAISSSNAANSAANAEKSAANQSYINTNAQEQSADALMMNPAAIAANDEALRAQESQVQRQEQLAASINPALIEQGKQYMQLLQGQSAPVLKQLQDQRALQRQQLVQQLQTQMGPGAETSTAGIQLLNQFDQQTSAQLSQAQMQYTGMMQQGALASPSAMNAFGTANTQLSDIGANNPSANTARLNASFTGANAAANQAVISSAGSQYTGQALTGQALSAFGGDLLKFGAAGAGKYANNTPTSGGIVGAGAGGGGASNLYMPNGSVTGNSYDFNEI